jgi:hypothetical protein
MATARLSKTLLSCKPRGHRSVGRGKTYSVEVGNMPVAHTLEEEEEEDN